MYPALGRIRACSLAVACAVIRRAMREELTDLRDDARLDESVSAAMWMPAYRRLMFEPTPECMEAH